MTATPPPGQPGTPAEALRWAAGNGDRLVDPADLLRWADELDAAPAAGDRPVEPTAESAPEPATSEQWRAAYDAKVQDFAKETARSSALASHLLTVLDAVDAVAERAVPAWSPLGVGVTKPGWEALLATARQARAELDASRPTDPGPVPPAGTEAQ